MAKHTKTSKDQVKLIKLDEYRRAMEIIHQAVKEKKAAVWDGKEWKIVTSE